MARLRKTYEETIKDRLKERLGIQNVLALPRVDKITVSCGVGAAKDNKKLLQDALEILVRVSGQKAVVTKAKRPIAQFKLRAGMPVGAMVTLRGDRAYEFLDRLISISIPRIRDFRGLNPKSFDRQGNYSMGVQEQIIFPEINYDEIDVLRGMDIIITTTARNAAEGKVLLEAFNFPFKKTVTN